MNENLNKYNSSEIVNWYLQLNEIAYTEKQIFTKYGSLILTGHVLDIGFGGGRTTRYLLNKCKSYTGIDYSISFVNATLKKFPGARLLHMDATNLSAFSSEFQFVLFSLNGIDYVNLENRIKILAEAYRVLQPGGIFFFSTHNKEYMLTGKKPWKNTNNSFITNLKTWLKLLPYMMRKLSNSKKEKLLAEYAIINDCAHNYNFMTFYTSPEFLLKQLQDTGFSDIRFYSHTGEDCPPGRPGEWIYVTAEKPY